ncbi:MAG: YraN family protein [Flavobacteriaceae bacterium]|nr:YraN family protein [Flavobacteriaceae bacterium]
MAEHNDFGRIAEEFIASKYQKNGYTILARNWRFYPLEIDIIAEKNNEIVFVEVKARKTDYFGDPIESVSRKKKQFMVKAANEYLELNQISKECRFDIAVVLQKKDGLASEVYVNAFEPYEL